MIDYRLDPKNLPQLTPEVQQRLDKARLDYSDIPPFDDQFFSKAKRPAFDDTMLNNPEAITEIAIRAFARAKAEAIRENDRLGIPSYGSKDGKIVVKHPERGTTSLKDGEAHPAAHGALEYLNALSFEQRQDFLLTFSSLAIEGNRLAEVCFGTLRRLIDGEPVSDRYLLGLAWEIKSIIERR